MKTITAVLGQITLILHVFLFPISGWAGDHPPESITGIWTTNFGTEKEFRIEILQTGDGIFIGRLMACQGTQQTPSNVGQIIIDKIKVDGTHIEGKVNFRLILDDPRACVPEAEHFAGRLSENGLQLKGKLKEVLIMDFGDEDCDSEPGEGIMIAFHKEEDELPFRIEGPETVNWNSTSTYQLVYVKEGEHKVWRAAAKWKLEDKDNRGIQVEGTSSSERSVKTPETFDKMDEVEVVLKAQPKGDFGGNPIPPKFFVSLRIKVSNVSEACAKLRQLIDSKQKEHTKLTNELAEKRIELQDHEMPQEWKEADREDEGKDLIDKISQLENDYKEAGKATEAIKNGYEELKKSKAVLFKVQRSLFKYTEPSKIKRARIAIERYNQSEGTDEDKLQFLLAYAGTRQDIAKRITDPGLQEDFNRLFKEAREKQIIPFAWGLQQIASIAMLGLPGPGMFRSSGLGMMKALKFSIPKLNGLRKIIANQNKFDIDLFYSNLDRSISNLNNLSLKYKEIKNLASRIVEMDNNGASQDEIKELTDRLQDKILHTYIETVTTVRSLEERVKEVRILRNSALTNLKEVEKKLNETKSKLKDFKKKERDYNYEMLDAINNKNRLERKIEENEKKVAELDEELKSLDSQLKQNCTAFKDK